MKKFEFFVNIGLILSIAYIGPGLILNGQKVSTDSLNFWFAENKVISETTKIQSMEDFQRQKVSKKQTEQALKSIFENP